MMLPSSHSFRYSLGDIVTFVFSSPTNNPSASSIVTFSPSIGGVAATWFAGGTQLVVRVADTTGVNSTAVDVATGSLVVTVGGVKSASGLSLPSLPVRGPGRTGGPSALGLI